MEAGGSKQAPLASQTRFGTVGEALVAYKSRHGSHHDTNTHENSDTGFHNLVAIDLVKYIADLRKYWSQFGFADRATDLQKMVASMMKHVSFVRKKEWQDDDGDATFRAEEP